MTPRPRSPAPGRPDSTLPRSQPHRGRARRLPRAVPPRATLSRRPSTTTPRSTPCQPRRERRLAGPGKPVHQDQRARHPIPSPAVPPSASQSRHDAPDHEDLASESARTSAWRGDTVSGVGTEWIPGLELSRGFYHDVVRPLLGDVRHSAGLLGWGSDVLGYDTARSNFLDLVAGANRCGRVGGHVHGRLAGDAAATVLGRRLRCRRCRRLRVARLYVDARRECLRVRMCR